MRKQFRQLFNTTLIFSLSLICLQNVTVQDSTKIRIAGIILKWIPRECELNYKRAEKLIREAASKGAKIVCTTESFLDGYAIRDNHLTLTELIQLAEPIPGGDYIASLQILADETNIYLIAGLTEREDDTLFNSSVLINPERRTIWLILKSICPRWQYGMPTTCFPVPSYHGPLPGSPLSAQRERSIWPPSAFSAE